MKRNAHAPHGPAEGERVAESKLSQIAFDLRSFLIYTDEYLVLSIAERRRREFLEALIEAAAQDRAAPLLDVC